jgi:histidine ammonia-lyase
MEVPLLCNLINVTLKASPPVSRILRKEMLVLLNGRGLTLDQVLLVAEQMAKVSVSETAKRRMSFFRRRLEAKLEGGETIYGVNTGFGSLSDRPISDKEVRQLQLNLVRSHSVGVGDPLSMEVVRAAMVLRLNSMLRGNSAVRPAVAMTLMEFLNRQITPFVPSLGSLGACLPADSLVYTNPSGPKEISRIKPGDMVYSYAGSLTRTRVVARNGIPNNFRHQFEGDLRTSRVLRVIDSGVQQTYRLQTYTRELVSTENHPVLKLCIERETKGKPGGYSLEWTELRQVKVNDLILAVKKLRDEGTALPLDLPYLRETTPDFMKLLGMIVGDGYVRLDLKSIWIALPPGPERRKYSELIGRLTGKRPAEYKDCIVIYSRLLAKLVATWGLAKKALEKRIPPWVFGLPVEQRIAFLEGYSDADATFYNAIRVHKNGHKWHQEMIRFDAPNANLIKDFRVLAISCGMRCGKIRTRQRTRGLWFNGNRLYNYNTPSTLYQFRVMPRGFFPYSFNGKVSIDITNPYFFFDKVVSIEPSKPQRVFDIEVEGSHNFVTEGLVVHNSGDLAPSAHMSLALIGEGLVYFKHKLVESKMALARARLKPIILEAKEGLSLINGTHYSTALACIALGRAKLLLNAANVSLALAVEVLGACGQSFDERLISLRGAKGQESVSAKIRTILDGSDRIRAKPVPQDAYSIRCAPQVHGSLEDAIEFSSHVIGREINSVTDNPVMSNDGEMLHGGNFHAQSIAMVSDLLGIALSYLGVISLARIHLLLASTSDNRKFFARSPGLSSGLMLAEYTANALAAQNSKEVYPLSTHQANVSGGVEDHASFGVNCGLKALAIGSNVSKIIAIELICASAGIDLFEGKGLAATTSRAHRFVKRYFPPLLEDRQLSGEIERLAGAVLAGRLTSQLAA